MCSTLYVCVCIVRNSLEKLYVCVCVYIKTMCVCGCACVCVCMRVCVLERKRACASEKIERPRASQPASEPACARVCVRARMHVCIDAWIDRWMHGLDRRVRGERGIGRLLWSIYRPSIYLSIYNSIVSISKEVVLSRQKRKKRGPLGIPMTKLDLDSLISIKSPKKNLQLDREIAKIRRGSPDTFSPRIL